jgi:hypothetical protein
MEQIAAIRTLSTASSRILSLHAFFFVSNGGLLLPFKTSQIIMGTPCIRGGTGGQSPPFLLMMACFYLKRI